MKNAFHVFNAIILSAGTIWSFILWKALPEKIPIHFGFNGMPDRWTDKGWELIVLILLPLFMTVLLYGLTLLSRKYTWLINVPEKDRLLALPAEKQGPFWDMLMEFMAALAACVSILLFSLVYSLGEVAMGRQTGLSWIFFAAFVPMILCIIVYIVRLRKSLTQCFE